MELSHEMAGLIISVVGLLLVVAAWPVPRQVRRWHVLTLDRVEPVMIGWLLRVIGLAVFMLGIMTAMTAVE